jgi:hypothetical protein
MSELDGLREDLSDGDQEEDFGIGRFDGDSSYDGAASPT